MRGSRRGGGVRGSGHPLKNHKSIGFLSNLVRIPWKITNLPSQHSMLGVHRHASEKKTWFKSLPNIDEIFLERSQSHDGSNGNLHRSESINTKKVWSNHSKIYQNLSVTNQRCTLLKVRPVREVSNSKRTKFVESKKVGGGEYRPAAYLSCLKLLSVFLEPWARACIPACLRYPCLKLDICRISLQIYICLAKTNLCVKALVHVIHVR